MKITILENSKIKYQGRYLTPHQTYNDIDDKTAQDLIASNDAKLAADEISGASVASAPQAGRTPGFDPKAEGYKGEAKLTEKQRKELEEKGETTDSKGNVIKKDETPVDNSKPAEPAAPVEKTEVLGEDGQPLTEEQIRAKEQAAAVGTTEQPATTGELQKTGEEVPPQQ